MHTRAAVTCMCRQQVSPLVGGRARIQTRVCPAVVPTPHPCLHSSAIQQQHPACRSRLDLSQPLTLFPTSSPRSDTPSQPGRPRCPTYTPAPRAWTPHCSQPLPLPGLFPHGSPLPPSPPCRLLQISCCLAENTGTGKNTIKFPTPLP